MLVSLQQFRDLIPCRVIAKIAVSCLFDWLQSIKSHKVQCLEKVCPVRREHDGDDSIFSKTLRTCSETWGLAEYVNATVRPFYKSRFSATELTDGTSTCIRYLKIVDSLMYVSKQWQMKVFSSRTRAFHYNESGIGAALRISRVSQRSSAETQAKRFNCWNLHEIEG
jgi:hypothetical protein